MLLAHLLAVALSYSSAPVALQQPPADRVEVLSVTPATAVRAGESVTFTFELMVTLESADDATVQIGFNSEAAFNSKMTHVARIKRGTQRVTGKVTTTPRDWGSVSSFAALIVIAPSERSLPIGFRPSAPTLHPIEVLAGTPPSVATDAEFKIADAAARRRILEELERGGTTLGVDSVVEIIRDAARDRDPNIRLLAMKAVGGRALASALIRFRAMPGAPPDPITARRSVAPQTWLQDDERLGQVLWDVIAERARRDSDIAVKIAALRAMPVFGRLDGLAPYTTEHAALCIEVFEEDRSAEVRAEAIKTLAKGVNDSADVRAAIMRALRDPDSFVRQMAVTSIHLRPNKTPLVPFSEAEPALLLLLNDRAPEYRVTAAQALGAYSGAAASVLPRLDRMALNDPDDEVRHTAALAATMIRSVP